MRRSTPTCSACATSSAQPAPRSPTASSCAAGTAPCWCRWIHGAGSPVPMRDRRGISLFEAVAAMAIVGITAVSALSAVGSEMRAAERSRRALEVEALAAQRVDYLDMLTDLQLQSLPDTVAKGKFDPPLD